MLRILAIVNCLAVHIERFAARLHRVACNSDNAFNEMVLPVVRRDEDEHIPARRFVEIEHLDVHPRNLYPVDKLTHQNLISDKQRIFH